MSNTTPARDVFVWASLVPDARYAPGDLIPDGGGAYLWAGQTFSAASDYILTGGAVARSEMTAVLIDPSGHPAHWVLRQPDQPDLHIPVNAEGADDLFDAFAALPGLRTEYMLARMKAPGDQPTVIWQKRTVMLH